MAATDRTVKAFLYKRMYEHWHLNRSHSKARRVVMDLFGLLFAEPNCLPPPWRERAEAAERAARARLVADYIAGMTDRYALDEHRGCSICGRDGALAARRHNRVRAAVPAAK
jgi:dGTPase